MSGKLTSLMLKLQPTTYSIYILMCKISPSLNIDDHSDTICKWQNIFLLGSFGFNTQTLHIEQYNKMQIFLRYGELIFL